MRIFAPKCARCGQRTRNMADGKPTCDDCAREMQLILDAQEENIQLCPRDASPMKKEIAHMMIIDKCPQCHGVWLDGGELEKLSVDLQAEAFSAMSSVIMPY